MQWIPPAGQVEGQPYLGPPANNSRIGFLPHHTHLVKPGENVGQIANMYGIDPGGLMRLNNLTVGRPIHAGMRLRLR